MRWPATAAYAASDTFPADHIRGFTEKSLRNLGVASIDLPGQAGFNVFCWDGRDSRAHDTAQGVYLYRLRATDPNGKTVTRDGRMIRAR